MREGLCVIALSVETLYLYDHLFEGCRIKANKQGAMHKSFVDRLVVCNHANAVEPPIKDPCSI